MKKIIIAVVKAFLKVIYRPIVIGAQNLETVGGFVLTANHRSNWDVLVLYAFLNKELYFMAKADLFKNKFFGWFLKKFGAFPVKRGANDLGAIKHAIHILNDGKILGIFPQGKRTDEFNVDDAKAGAVLIASRCKKPVIPVAISGEYKLGSKICINIGSPIYFGEQKLSPEELNSNTVVVMEKIKELSETV
ncbi:MAG: 1-acyl-sn-glycerol-3-phosphate acyltransferase [Clostridia bacterium]|nr:1-acyl-sn-glycerol-3-phosphate acyltransferase [Clostridia bacterium]